MWWSLSSGWLLMWLRTASRFSSFVKVPSDTLTLSRRLAVSSAIPDASAADLRLTPFARIVSNHALRTSRVFTHETTETRLELK